MKPQGPNTHRHRKLRTLLRKERRYLATTESPDFGSAHHLANIARHLIHSLVNHSPCDWTAMDEEIDRLQTWYDLHCTRRAG